MSESHADVIEALAAEVSAHPDYRLLRRIKIDPPPIDQDRSEWFKGIVIDTETTGLDSSQCKVIELGMSSFYWHKSEGFKAFGETRSWFNDPGEPLTAEIIRVTGINDEMVRGQAINYAEAEAMRAGAHLIVAHNAEFDRPICERELPQLMLNQLPWACSQTEIDWRGTFGSPSSALQVVAWNSGYFYEAHRASNDVEALAFLLANIEAGGVSALQMLLDSVRMAWARFYATNAAYDKKDVLKARGYSWSSAQKVWWIDIKEPAAADIEQGWLRDNVLDGRPPGIQIIRAADRYSDRVK